MYFFAGVELDVIVGGFDPIDLFDIDKVGGVAVGDGDPFEFRDCSWQTFGRKLKLVQQLGQTAGELELAFVAEVGFDSVAGGGEACGVNRFEQIVNRVDFERRNGVMIIGGDKDHRRQDFGRHRFENIETAHFGHLYIEKGEVRFHGLDKFHCLGAVNGLIDNNKVIILFEMKPDAIAGERFIIDNDRAYA